MLKLQVLREAHRFSQAEIARRAQMHPTTISLAESGRFILGPEQLRKVAEVLGVPLEEAPTLLNEITRPTRDAL